MLLMLHRAAVAVAVAVDADDIVAVDSSGCSGHLTVVVKSQSHGGSGRRGMHLQGLQACSGPG